jgi:predicted deacylase
VPSEQRTSQGASTVFDGLRWRSLEVPGEAATGSLAILVGEIGSGAPRALLTAGVHGDEGPWGALALRAALGAMEGAALRGSLQVVLAANPLAAQADARNAPLDVLDLNRSFPGSADGSHTERLAQALAPLATEADVLVDLHGGGSWCVNAFVFRVAGSEDLADLTGAPFALAAPDRAGTLSHHARAHGARVVALEMGGRSREEVAWAERIAAAVRRVLVHEGVLEGTVDAPPPPMPVGPSAVLRPPVGGVFEPTLREEAVGTVVPGGTELGRLLDLRTLALRHVFVAPYPQTALLLLRPHVAVVEGGAMTYVVAPVGGGS